MRQQPEGTMLPYWFGLFFGLFGTIGVASYLKGCGGTMVGSIVFVLMITVMSGLGDSLFLIGGLERWRDRVGEAGWPWPFLFVVGLLAGTLAPVIALVILYQTAPLQHVVWYYVIALCVFVFGPAVFSWIAIFLLSRAGGEARQSAHPSDEASP